MDPAIDQTVIIIVAIVGGVALVFFIVVVVIAVCCLCRMKERSSKGSYRKSTNCVGVGAVIVGYRLGADGGREGA